MRVVGRRTKKLIVAFHFQFANQAAWECDDCRRAGLEERRRCTWSKAGREAPERIVWARKGAAATRCPKSYITGQSLSWLEDFAVRRRLGFDDVGLLAAREVEAFVILEQQWAGEVRNGS